MYKFLLLLLVLHTGKLEAEDGYRLWLRYDRISNTNLLKQYRTAVTGVMTASSTPVLRSATKELVAGLSGLLAVSVNIAPSITNGTLVLASKDRVPKGIDGAGMNSSGTNSSGTNASGINASGINYPGINYEQLGKEGYSISTQTLQNKKIILITANTDQGLLYGSFAFLRLIQTGSDITKLNISSAPSIDRRILNHWDNLNRTVERGYAGLSLWNWHTLPQYIDQRYTDYARANASIGINGTVLTNVNANALILSKEYLEKVAVLANLFRTYGIRVYLTARFSAPIEAGGLKTADPLDKDVQRWWQEKVKEIYQYIPDFGGFLVKANSEGQPGPQNYGRTHADGANLLADAVKPFNGIVIWRAFVYSNEVPEDRVKQAYTEFKPLDGKFRENVMVQVKNGPLDFQPREPFHPLFGSMPKTPLVMEFQLTQEYLGQATHLVYETPLFTESLNSDTYTSGKGSTVAKIVDGTATGMVDGSLDKHRLTAIAGVSNIGNERNWTGHPFAQANWYAFGRIAWDHQLVPAAIANEWIRQSFSNDDRFVSIVQTMMLQSRETMVNYMTPLGLHHIMGTSHHYGPAPWVSDAGRADWNPVYYHKADSNGIGFDRSAKGSNALEQYSREVAAQYEDLAKCPEELLLWYHHVPWNHKMKSGRTLWEELCAKYNQGVDSVRIMQKTWDGMHQFVDAERHQQVKMLLQIQADDAVWWRDACLSYFSTFSRQKIPAKYEQPKQSLEYYKSQRFRYASGIGGNP